MPIPRVKIEIEMADATELPQLKVARNHWLSGRAVLDTPVEGDDKTTHCCDKRFVTQEDALAYYNRVRTFLLNPDAIPPGVVNRRFGKRLKGKVSFHLCTHEDAVVQNCTTTSYQGTVR